MGTMVDKCESMAAMELWRTGELNSHFVRVRNNPVVAGCTTSTNEEHQKGTRLQLSPSAKEPCKKGCPSKPRRVSLARQEQEGAA
jgi:hypothetical protein